MTTAFYHDERCLWHSWGEAVLTLPVGGYVQPPAGTSHLENPETKRRFKNLLEVSGLWDHLDVRKAEPVIPTAPVCDSLGIPLRSLM